MTAFLDRYRNDMRIAFCKGTDLPYIMSSPPLKDQHKNKKTPKKKAHHRGHREHREHREVPGEYFYFISVSPVEDRQRFNQPG